MTHPVMHFEVAGKDPATLKSFYGDLFGWSFEDLDAPEMPYTIVTTSDGAISGGIGKAPEGHLGHTIFYVNVEDIDASLAKAEELGGKRVFDPMEIPGGGKIAMFTDPEGHEIGLPKAGM